MDSIAAAISLHISPGFHQVFEFIDSSHLSPSLILPSTSQSPGIALAASPGFCSYKMQVYKMQV